MKRNLLIISSLILVATLGLTFLRHSKNNFLKKKYHYSLKTDQRFNETESKEFEQELHFYLKRFERDPASFQNLSIMAHLMIKKSKVSGDEEVLVSAREYAEKSLAIMPHYNISALYALADIAQMEHKFFLAVEYARKIQQENPQSPEAFRILTNSFLAMGELAQAFENSQYLLRIVPDSNSYALNALVLAELGETEKAKKSFTNALALDDEDQIQASWVRTLFARFFLEQEMLPEAFTLLNEALRIHHGNAFALYQMGKYFEKDGRDQEALSFFKKAFSQSKDISFLIAEAKTYNRLGDSVLAREVLAQAEMLSRFEITESKTSHRRNLIEILYEQGKFKEALELSLEEKKTRHDSETLLLLARTFAAVKDYPNAEITIKEMLAKNMRSLPVMELAENIRKSR